MVEPDDTSRWSEHDQYVERMVRRKVGQRALRQIHALFVEMERTDQQARRVAVILVVVFAVVMMVFLGYLGLK